MFYVLNFVPDGVYCFVYNILIRLCVFSYHICKNLYVRLYSVRIVVIHYNCKRAVFVLVFYYYSVLIVVDNIFNVGGSLFHVVDTRFIISRVIGVVHYYICALYNGICDSFKYFGLLFVFYPCSGFREVIYKIIVRLVKLNFAGI